MISLAIHSSRTHFKTQHGSTALICASAKGHAACVRLLVKSGADKDAENNVRIRAATIACAHMIFESGSFEPVLIFSHVHMMR
jgi:hypothetical protein